MANTNQSLGERIREIRKRHFGAPGGKIEFANRLRIDPAEYERYERGEVPPGELLVRLCELTGEDLQWLLTGVASRGTVVIAGARSRHQALLTHIARIIDEQPTMAAPIEAFVDLLTRGPRTKPALVAPGAREPGSDASRLIPILDPDELPDHWPPDDGGGLPLASLPSSGGADRRIAELMTTHSGGAMDRIRNVTLLSIAQDGGRPRDYVVCDELSEVSPRLFALRVSGDEALDDLAADRCVISSPDCGARLGAMAICKCAGRPAFCRVWLGSNDDVVHLGRPRDGGVERIPRDGFRWACDALFWVAPAA